MRQSILRGGIGVMVAGMVVAAGPAHAGPTSVAVQSGVLGVAAPAVNDFAVVTPTGAAQVVEAPMEPFSVTDARGSGQGWVLKAEATALREWDGSGYVPGGKTLPEGSLSFPAVSVVSEDTDSAAPEVVASRSPVDGTTVQVALASVGTGMGRFRFSPAGGLRIAVPASAYARTYRSELSLSVTSGP